MRCALDNWQSKPAVDSWPKLSETLAGPKSPDRCQSCSNFGLSESFPVGGSPLQRWREHDKADKPTPTVVVLCGTCADRIIESHPRLYAQLDRNEPYPGVMGLCVDCKHRQGVSCPLAKFVGGPGVTIIGPKPTTAHVQRSPRRLSGWIEIWPGPARDCDRREVTKE